MPSQTATALPSLFDKLREREAQARLELDAFNACMEPLASPDSMLYWLTNACAEARLAAGRKQVHVAAEIGRDQATIARFEKHRAWPRNTDEIVGAYARDLNIDPVELWGAALVRWRDHNDGRDVEPIPANDPRQRAVDAADEAARRTRERKQQDARDKPDRRKRAQGE